MKKLFIIGLTVGLGLMSCQKESTTVVEKPIEEIEESSDPSTIKRSAANFNPEEVIIGPTTVCEVETFEVPHRIHNFSVQGQNGIANVTQLGPTTYQVERIDNQVGIISLVALIPGPAINYRRDIVIGGAGPKINGSTVITGGNTYTYNVVKNDPNSTLTINPGSAPGGAPYTIQLSGNQIILNTSAFSGSAHDYSIILRATETSVCGISTETRLNIRLRGGQGPIN